MVMAGVMERHAGLRVLLAHGGGALLRLRGRLRHAHGFQPQARREPARAAGGLIRRFYFDTLTHDDALLRALIDYAGADHVLLGSDYPFDMGDARHADTVRALGLAPEVEARDPRPATRRACSARGAERGDHHDADRRHRRRRAPATTA